MPLTHGITLDMGKRHGLPHPRVTVRVGDVDTQAISARLVSDGQPYAPTLPAARLDILHADRTWSRVTATVDGSVVQCVLPAEALGVAGACKLAYFVFYDGERAESTEGFELRILGAVEATGEQAKAYDDMLTKLWAKWDALVREAEKNELGRVDAEHGRESAETSRTSAEAQRAAAETARQSAETARAAAESARVTAEHGRATAETARSEAERARATAEDARAKAEQGRVAQHAITVEATDAANAAATAAGNAAKSANDAAAGADAAKDSAGEAAADARKAAEEARDFISADRKIYLKRITDASGDTRPVIVDMTIG